MSMPSTPRTSWLGVSGSWGFCQVNLEVGGLDTILEADPAGNLNLVH